MISSHQLDAEGGELATAGHREENAERQKASYGIDNG
jgi:hypothetical protein